MNNFGGIGPNFNGVERKGLYGERTKSDNPEQVAKKAVDEGNKHIQHKNPESMLNAMHNYGAMNLVSPNISSLKNDPKMVSRIGDFMGTFETEVEKGLKVFGQEFPGVDEATARGIVSEAVMKASEL